MAHYKEDHRQTLQLFSGSLDLLLPQDSVARDIWACLEHLDFAALDAIYRNDAVGRPGINPRCLTAIWMLGLLRCVTGSVRLAYLCGQDIEFRWLIGDASVEKSTLCDFRKNHKEDIALLSAQVLLALGAQGLLPGVNMGVDGTIVRSASSRHSVKTRKSLERQKKHLEEILRDKLSQADSDSEEVKVLEKRQQLLMQALDSMTLQGLTNESDRITMTEPEAKLKRQKDGSFAPGFNVQVVTDLNSGAIIHAQVVDSGNDCGQLKPQYEQAKIVLEELSCGEGIQSITADSAYHDTLQLLELEQQAVDCYVPEERNSNRHTPDVSPEYYAKAFIYDEQTNTMCCPQGQDLKWRKLNNGQTASVYQAPAKTCQNCPAKAQCCPKSKEGRSVNRSLYIQEMETISKRLETQDGQTKRHARWVVCEGAFARLNGLLHWDRCRMWGMAGAKMELCWRQLTYNLMLLTGRWKPLIPARKVT